MSFLVLRYLKIKEIYSTVSSLCHSVPYYIIAGDTERRGMVSVPLPLSLPKQQAVVRYLLAKEVSAHL